MKFLLVLLVTMALSLGSYHVAVRHTFLGVWLHGRRERTRPALQAGPHFSPALPSGEPGRSKARSEV